MGTLNVSNPELTKRLRAEHVLKYGAIEELIDVYWCSVPSIYRFCKVCTMLNKCFLQASRDPVSRYITRELWLYKCASMLRDNPHEGCDDDAYFVYSDIEQKVMCDALSPLLRSMERWVDRVIPDDVDMEQVDGLPRYLWDEVIVAMRPQERRGKGLAVSDLIFRRDVRDGTCDYRNSLFNGLLGFCTSPEPLRGRSCALNDAQKVELANVERFGNYDWLTKVYDPELLGRVNRQLEVSKTLSLFDREPDWNGMRDELVSLGADDPWKWRLDGDLYSKWKKKVDESIAYRQEQLSGALKAPAHSKEKNRYELEDRMLRIVSRMPRSVFRFGKLCEILEKGMHEAYRGEIDFDLSTRPWLRVCLALMAENPLYDPETDEWQHFNQRDKIAMLDPLTLALREMIYWSQEVINSEPMADLDMWCQLVQTIHRRLTIPAAPRKTRDGKAIEPPKTDYFVFTEDELAHNEFDDRVFLDLFRSCDSDCSLQEYSECEMGPLDIKMQQKILTEQKEKAPPPPEETAMGQLETIDKACAKIEEIVAYFKTAEFDAERYTVILPQNQLILMMPFSELFFAMVELNPKELLTLEYEGQAIDALLSRYDTGWKSLFSELGRIVGQGQELRVLKDAWRDLYAIAYARMQQGGGKVLKAAQQLCKKNYDAFSAALQRTAELMHMQDMGRAGAAASRENDESILKSMPGPGSNTDVREINGQKLFCGKIEPGKYASRVLILSRCRFPDGTDEFATSQEGCAVGTIHIKGVARDFNIPLTSVKNWQVIKALVETEDEAEGYAQLDSNWRSDFKRVQANSYSNLDASDFARYVHSKHGRGRRPKEIAPDDLCKYHILTTPRKK